MARSTTPTVESKGTECARATTARAARIPSSMTAGAVVSAWPRTPAATAAAPGERRLG